MNPDRIEFYSLPPITTRIDLVTFEKQSKERIEKKSSALYDLKSMQDCSLPTKLLIQAPFNISHSNPFQTHLDNPEAGGIFPETATMNPLRWKSPIL